jgi:hypothetical protein
VKAKIKIDTIKRTKIIHLIANLHFKPNYSLKIKSKKTKSEKWIRKIKIKKKSKVKKKKEPKKKENLNSPSKLLF